MANTKMDPDFLAWMAANPHLLPDPNQAPPTSIQEQRTQSDAVVHKIISSNFTVAADIVETKHTVTSSDGAEFLVHELASKDWPQATEPQPAFIYIHGGGVLACPVDPICRPAIAQFATDFGVRTFGVEYRLSLHHPFPAPLDDCYAALEWLVENADRLNVDPKRIGLMGESGGATLVAGVTLMARDRKFHTPIAKQLLIYPMIDDRSSNIHFNPDSPLHQSLKQSFIIGTDLCWDAYVGADKRGKLDADVSPYAAPSRATDLRGLPPTYIDLGSMDWFLAESYDFAARLAKAEVEVEFHVYAGVPHCFELLAPNIPVTLNAKENRRRAIRSV